MVNFKINDMQTLEHIKRPTKDEQIAAMKSYDALANVLNELKGSNPEIDQAIDRNIGIRDFLRQGVMEQADLAETLARMKQLVG